MAIRQNTTTSDPLSQETSFQGELLYGLARLGPVHGLGLKQWLEEYHDEEINHGRLYPNLDTLVSRGLVSKEQADRRTNHYDLTRRGRNALSADLAWRAECLNGEGAESD